MLGTLLYIIGIFTTTATQEPKNPKSNDISVSSVEDSDSILNTNEINESNNVKNDAIVDTDNTTHHVLRHQFTKKTINKFTIFLESVLETLNTFDDSDLKYFFNVFREEIKKHHYNDCKFNELLDDKYETFIINYLNELITLPAMYIRQEMMILSRKIEDELYDSNEKQLFESINLLYKNDSYSSFKNILTNLDIYGQKSRKHMDLVQIIRNGLRFLIYDHCVPNIYRHNYIDKRNISKSNTNDALRIEKYSKVNILMTTRYVKRDPTTQSRSSTTVKQNVTRKELVFEMKEPTKKQTTPQKKIQQVTSKQYIFERKTSTKTQKPTQDKIQDVTSEEFVFLTSASTKKQTTPQEKIQVTKKQKTTQENIQHDTNKEFVSKTTEHTKKQTTPQKKITNSGKTSTRKYKKTTIHDKFEVITNDGDINNNIITDVYDEETTTHNTKHTSKKLKQQSSHTTKNGHTSRQVYIEKDLESKYDTHKNLTTEIITMATLYPQYLPPEHHDEKQKGKHKEKHKEKHTEKHKEKHEEKHKEKHEEKHKEKHEEKHKEKHKETVSSTTDISQTIIVKPGELFSNSKSHETNEECCTSKPKGIQNKKRKKKIKQKPSTHKRHSSIEKSNENVTQESDHQDNTVLKTRQTLTHVTFKKHKPRKNNTPRKKKHHEAQYSPEPHPIEHNRYLVKPDYEQNTPDTIFPKSKFHLKHKDRQFTIEMLSIPRDNYMHKRATTDTIFPRRPKISNQIYSVINVKRVNTKEYYDYNDRGDGTNNDNAISKVTHAEKKKKIKKISTKVTVQEKRNNKRKDIKKHKTKGIKTTKVGETREIKVKHHKESHKLKNSDNVKPKQIKRDREREKSHSSANNKKVLKGKHSLKHSNRHKHQHYDKQTTKKEVTIKSYHNKYKQKLKYDSEPAVLDANVRKTKNKSKRKHKGENKLAKGKHVKRRQILDKIKTNNSVKYIGVTYNLERNSDKQIKREYASDDQRKYKDSKYDVYAKYNEKLQYLPGDQDLNNNSYNINDKNNTVYVKHKRVHVKPSKVKEKQINNGNIDVNIKKEEDGDRNTTALLNSTISNATTTPTQSTDSKTLGINGDFLAKILSISKFVSEMAKKAYPQDNKNESKELIDVQEEVTLNQNEERNSKVTKDTDALQDIDTIINKTLSLTVINTDINESAELHKNYKYNTFDPNTVTPTTQITPNNFYLKF